MRVGCTGCFITEFNVVRLGELLICVNSLGMSLGLDIGKLPGFYDFYVAFVLTFFSYLRLFYNNVFCSIFWRFLINSLL